MQAALPPGPMPSQPSGSEFSSESKSHQGSKRICCTDSDKIGQEPITELAESAGAEIRRVTRKFESKQTVSSARLRFRDRSFQPSRNCAVSPRRSA